MKKFKKAILTSAITSLLSFGAAQSASASQQIVDAMSSQLYVKYTIVDNQAGEHGVNCAALGADWAACNKATISLTNKGAAINDKDWAIYFSSIRMILAVNNDQFTITHLTGDLHKIEPTEKFEGFPAKGTIDIPIIGEYWQVSESDAIPRWYVTSTDAKAKVISNTNTEKLANFVAPLGENWKRTTEDHNILMNPATRFERNADIQKLDITALRGQIIPTPTKLTVGNTNIILNKNGVDLQLSGLNKASLSVLSQQFKSLGVPVTDKGFKIKATIDASKFDDVKSGAYQLNLEEKQATITAYDE